MGPQAPQDVEELVTFRPATLKDPSATDHFTLDQQSFDSLFESAVVQRMRRIPIDAVAFQLQFDYAYMERRRPSADCTLCRRVA